MLAEVTWPRLVVFDKPGSTRYLDFLKKGDKVKVTKGWSYAERDWKDKEFVEVETAKGMRGYINVNALRMVERRKEFE